MLVRPCGTSIGTILSKPLIRPQEQKKHAQQHPRQAYQLEPHLPVVHHRRPVHEGHHHAQPPHGGQHGDKRAGQAQRVKIKEIRRHQEHGYQQDGPPETERRGPPAHRPPQHPRDHRHDGRLVERVIHLDD